MISKPHGFFNHFTTRKTIKLLRRKSVREYVEKKTLLRTEDNQKNRNEKDRK